MIELDFVKGEIMLFNWHLVIGLFLIILGVFNILISQSKESRQLDFVHTRAFNWSIEK